MTAQSAISRFHRDLTLGIVVKMLLIGVAVASVVGSAAGWYADATVVLLVVGGVWFVLSIRSAQGSRLAAASPSLIAAGRYDAAEAQIAAALKLFSISRNVKLLGLHQLAVLRHAQRRWQESALLASALLAQRRGQRGSGSHLLRSARLILAESLLELNDLNGTYDAIRRLHETANVTPNFAPQDAGSMTLAETMHLMLLQLDYESRIGAWASMMIGIPRKVELAELMSTDGAARTQALLALAAKRAGRPDWSQWLVRRVALLKEPSTVAAERPLLAELWR